MLVLSYLYCNSSIALKIFHIYWGVLNMSNKYEIEEDLYRAQSRLDDLCKQEGQENTGTQTVTIQPKYGEEMQSLREECSQLRIILEAMEASED